jgi:hypothetical protein
LSDDDEPDAPEDQPVEVEELPHFDAGDSAQVGKRNKKLDIQKREGDRFWQYIFSLKVGRREMFKLLQACKAFDTRFACGPNGFPQPEATWFQAGESEWGRRMRETWLVEHTENFARMLRENDPRFQKDSK